ncbi:hypothetical protein FE257_003579 [Aspergillus nanangensis]|uniref:Heterokaryon incompatibility domain-containing protein n=1 Tax=Aspergillus nanangensis TaxID=2582783 RepID=A0AAD4GXH2_ASPNN|nr:hypothetical protein FE257_003579 [Aspergillus nanangensis]
MSEYRGIKDRLQRIFKASGHKSESKALPLPPPQPQPQESTQGPENNTPDEAANSNRSSAKLPQADQEEEKFPDVSLALITNYTGQWCCFDYTYDDDGIASTSLATGVVSPPPHASLIGETRRTWASGTLFPPEFLGPKIFDQDWTHDAEYSLPPLLYDMVLRRVIDTSTLSELAKMTRYATISHVWGDHGIELDGTAYGVAGPIPIRNEEKLVRILEAARVIVGERYVWIDILCLDQDYPRPHKLQAEVAEMGRYFRNATGCFVWMDDAFDDCGEDWAGDVLGSLEAINRFWAMDRQGVSMNPESGAPHGLGPSTGIGKAADEMPGPEALEWIRKVRKLERAPWFRRVWTLQEAVVPKDFLICAPERHMISCSILCGLVGLVEAAARRLLLDGAMESVEIIHELHSSEVYKILKLRKLYQHGEVGFWHIAQAVRSRSCTVENDRAMGVSGMLQRTWPTLDHRMESKRIWGQTWEQALLESDFSALMYLGEQSSIYSMFADPVAGMPFISMRGRKPDPAPKETHWLKLVDGVAMKDVGCDRVRRVTGVMCTALEGALKEWMMAQAPFKDMDMETHLQLATAWGLPTHTQGIKGENGGIKHFSPGAYAAFLSLAPSWASPMLGRMKDKEFSQEVKRLFPRALLQRLRILHLLLGVNQGKHAVVLLQMANSDPQVGLISEPPDDPVIGLTPSSYHNHPGPGCLLVKVLEDGVFHKIGIGLGKAVRAHTFVSGQIIPPPRIPGLPWAYASSFEWEIQE